MTPPVRPKQPALLSALFHAGAEYAYREALVAVLRLDPSARRTAIAIAVIERSVAMHLSKDTNEEFLDGLHHAQAEFARQPQGLAASVPKPQAPRGYGRR